MGIVREKKVIVHGLETSSPQAYPDLGIRHLSVGRISTATFIVEERNHGASIQSQPAESVCFGYRSSTALNRRRKIHACEGTTSLYHLNLVIIYDVVMAHGLMIPPRTDMNRYSLSVDFCPFCEFSLVLHPVSCPTRLDVLWFFSSFSHPRNISHVLVSTTYLEFSMKRQINIESTYILFRFCVVVPTELYDPIP